MASEPYIGDCDCCKAEDVEVQDFVGIAMGTSRPDKSLCAYCSNLPSGISAYQRTGEDVRAIVRLFHILEERISGKATTS